MFVHSTAVTSPLTAFCFHDCCPHNLPLHSDRIMCLTENVSDTVDTVRHSLKTEVKNAEQIFQTLNLPV